MTDLRTAAQQALEALYEGRSVANSVSISNDRKICRNGCTLYAQTEEWCRWADGEVLPKLKAAITALEAALAQQAEPLTIERLRDALVASRIIPPAAVEDPDEYDDGVTLLRIEALHRRIT